MENEPSHMQQALPPEQTAAKVAILAECERLAEVGITFVVVHFDGAGDEGVNEEVKWHATEDYAYEESEIHELNFSYLQEHFETLVPYGYENGCGGFGDVILNVKTRKITVERNDRFEDYTTSNNEVQPWPTHSSTQKAAPENLAARPRTILQSTTEVWTPTDSLRCSLRGSTSQLIGSPAASKETRPCHEILNGGRS